MKRLAAFVIVMISSFAYAQLGQAAGGFADAQQRDLERRQQLQMQREAQQYASALARLQAQNAAALSASSQTLAKDISASGNNFLEICASVEIPPDKMNAADVANMYRCQGFMLGLRDGAGLILQLVQQSTPNPNPKGEISDFGICIPDEVSVLQAIRVVLKYIREHPEQAHLQSATLVFAADLTSVSLCGRYDSAACSKAMKQRATLFSLHSGERPCIGWDILQPCTK